MYDPYENDHVPESELPEQVKLDLEPEPEARMNAYDEPYEATFYTETRPPRMGTPYPEAPRYYAPAPEPVYAPEPKTARNDYIPPEPPKKKKSGKIGRLIAAACVFGVLAGACFGGVNLAIDHFAGDETPAAQTGGTAQQEIPYTAVQTSTGSGTAILDVTSVVKNAMPSMVSINVVATQTVESIYGSIFGNSGSYQRQVRGAGSGIIIGQNDTELLIVTNNHVVGDATQIAIEFIDGSSASAYIKGTNEDSDLAVIAVALSGLEQSTLDSIKIAVMGDSDSLELGEPAIAIGNALGYGQSVTVGYISALEREVTFTDGTMTLLQTDAAINPGNSGGALLNMDGEVIGINSAKYSSTTVEGMCYAIPISDAVPIINELMNAVVVPDSAKPYLGIVGQSVPASYQSYFGWPAGVYVAELTAGSPAASCGLQAGDIITGIKGTAVGSMDELQAILESCAVGETVELTVSRQTGAQSNLGGQTPMETLTISATLIARGDVE